MCVCVCVRVRESPKVREIVRDYVRIRIAFPKDTFNTINDSLYEDQ